MNHLFVEYVGFWRRFFAVLLDMVVLSALSTLYLYISQGPVYYQRMLSMTADNGHYGADAFFVQQLLPIFLTVVMWVKFKGTPGKLLLSCHVVDAKTLNSMTFAQALIRYAAYLISLLPLGLGFLWVIWDAKKQSFHDKIAGTVVIREDEADKALSELVREMVR